MTIEPDLAGFAEAQERIRQQQGFDVRFYGPLQETWGPEVQLSPESGRPFDPLASATGSAQSSAQVRCDLVLHPVKRGSLAAPADETRIGVMGTEDTVALMSASGFALASGASEAYVTRIDQRYVVIDRVVDEEGDSVRYLIFMQEK